MVCVWGPVIPPQFRCLEAIGKETSPAVRMRKSYTVPPSVGMRMLSQQDDMYYTPEI